VIAVRAICVVVIPDCRKAASPESITPGQAERA
jgi:hypothetical protein